MPGYGWHDAELSLVRMGRERGLSSGEIVAMLAEAGFSRSQKAVVNLCQRMGWPARVAQRVVCGTRGPVVQPAGGWAEARGLLG